MNLWTAGLIGAGIALVLTHQPHRQLRRVYHAARCARHGLFARDCPSCPKCGGPIEIISLVRLRRRRPRRTEALTVSKGEN